MILNYAIDRAEAEAGAFADGFGGVEGIENALRVANAGTGIGKLEHGFLAWRWAVISEASAGFLQGVHGIVDDLDEGLEKAGWHFRGRAAIGGDGDSTLNVAARDA